MIETPVSIPAGKTGLEGNLSLPRDPAGLVMFAHGSGSNRRSPRNRVVAEALHASNLGTLLFDLLTPGEAEERSKTFDIDLLAGRLHAAAEWCGEQPGIAKLPLGYFGASTGAAAALRAAAGEPAIRAVVSRGGRPDLAGRFLPKVTAPTLLIVGSEDEAVITMNEEALKHLACVKSLVMVPGATHLFEEPGAIEEVARHAAAWFTKYLRSG